MEKHSSALKKEHTKVNDVMEKLNKVNPMSHPAMPGKENPEFTEQVQNHLENA